MWVNFQRMGEEDSAAIYSAADDDDDDVDYGACKQSWQMNIGLS